MNSEYDYDNRMDAHHALGGDKCWIQGKGWVVQ